jgi:hypothetical protein
MEEKGKVKDKKRRWRIGEASLTIFEKLFLEKLASLRRGFRNPWGEIRFRG